MHTYACLRIPTHTYVYLCIPMHTCASHTTRMNSKYTDYLLLTTYLRVAYDAHELKRDVEENVARSVGVCGYA